MDESKKVDESKGDEFKGDESKGDESKVEQFLEPKQDYDLMSDEEYYAEMERKVAYYKIHYPDMYHKAQEWLQMLEHSEVYKNETGDNDNSSELLHANDILKNMNFNGLNEEDMTEKEILILNKVIPDWREKLVQ